MRFGFAVALATAVLSQQASGQVVPNLSGTWVMQADKSNFGELPGIPVIRPQSRTDVWNHQEPRLTIKRTVVTDPGPQSSDFVFAVDGKSYKNTVGPNELNTILKWDGQTLVMVSTISSPQGEVTITDRYTLSADGKTLNQARTYSVSGQELNQTIVLTKQP